jgi:hypothetical protein
MKKKYNKKDLIEIDIVNKFGDIKIRGFKHDEIKNKVVDILEKIKSYKLPETWDNIVEQLDHCSEFVRKVNLQKGKEVKEVLKKFMATMPNATVEKIERI